MIRVSIGGDLRIGVFANANEEVLSLDLSCINGKFVKLNSTDFTSFIKANSASKYFESNFKVFFRTHKLNPDHQFYALLPLDVTKPIEDNTLVLLRDIMLIMIPSHFIFYMSASFQKIDDGTYFLQSNSRESELHPYPRQESNFQFKETQASAISNFIKLFFERCPNLKYLNICRTAYSNSYEIMKNWEMAFLSLCISLESLILGETEISYKIQRCCALIHSTDEHTGETIYNNVKHIYTLRSKIVHGESSKIDALREYYDYMFSLVSRTLIALIVMNKDSKEDLNKWFAKTGYGQNIDFLEKANDDVNFDPDRSRSIFEDLKKYDKFKQ